MEKKCSLSGQRFLPSTNSIGLESHVQCLLLERPITGEEDEVLIEGKNVYWLSEGVLLKSFTVCGDVLQVKWCSFTQDNKKIFYLSILHTEGLMLNALDGKLLEPVLPCGMLSLWPLPNGILFQRCMDPLKHDSDQAEPTMFTLLHPLEEVKPLSYLSHNSPNAPTQNPSPPFLFSPSQRNTSLLNDSLSFASEFDMSVLFEEPDFICDPLTIVFSSNKMPILVTMNESSKKIIFWALHEKNNPYSQCSYEAAQKYTQLRHQYEEERHKQHVMSNLVGGGLDSSFQFEEQSSFFQLDESFSLPNESQIKAQVYIEWLAEFTVPNRISTSFMLIDRLGKIFVYLLCSGSNILRCYEVIFKNNRYHIQSHFELKQIAGAVPVHVMRPDSFPHQLLIPGIDRFPDDTTKERRSEILVLDVRGSVSLCSGKTKILSYEISKDLLEENQLTGKDFPLYLSNSVCNRVNLSFAKDKVLRCTIPLLPASSLYADVINAFECFLPESVVFSLIADSFDCLSDHPPGSWESFCACMLGFFMASETPSKENPQELTEWEQLLRSSFNYAETTKYKNILHKSKDNQCAAPCIFPGYARAKHTTPQTIHNYAEKIHSAIHLLFESYKLDMRSWEDSKALLIQLLIPLSQLLSLENHVDYYYRHIGSLSVVIEKIPANVSFGTLCSKDYQVVDCMNAFEAMIDKKFNANRFAMINKVPNDSLLSPFRMLRILCRLYHMLGGGSGDSFAIHKHHNSVDSAEQNQFTGNLTNHTTSLLAAGASFPILKSLDNPDKSPRTLPRNTDNVAEKIVLSMVEESIQVSDLEFLPFGIALALHEAIFHCRQKPPSDWSYSAYVLIGREDLASQWKAIRFPSLSTQSAPPPVQELTQDHYDESDAHFRIVDGTELNDPIISLRFSKDQRIQEVAKILSSSVAQLIDIDESNASEHELLHLQQQYLHRMAQRTLSLPIGRGMFTLATSSLLGTEIIPIPPLELSGKLNNSNGILKLASLDENIPLPDNLDTWGQFHNGVAAGLRIAPQQSKTNTWITYNKPKTPNHAHGGFLFGLGLQGHLKALKFPKVLQYLKENHTTTSIGLLMGLAASYKCSMDISVVKFLSIHIPALHPSPSSGMEVPPNVQIAALLGIGLVYMKTQHRGMTELLLDQINREPSIDKTFARESYCLTAGISLGLIILGKGKNCLSLSDLQLENRLLEYIHGSHEKVSYQVKTQTKNVTPDGDNTSLVLENKDINIDVTAPGAILAYGMLYLQTNEQEAAHSLQTPSTIYLLESVRLDMLLLRVLCKNLILWDSIEASEEWVESQIPLIIQNGIKELEMISFEQFHTVYHCYIHLIAALCLSIGLRFGGTHSQDAFHVIWKYIHLLGDLKHKKLKRGETLNKILLESCFVVCVISLSLVMSGSGNLQCLKFLRKLRYRKLDGDISYGHHLGISMSIGFLFLGGGRYAINRTPEAIAMLLCSLFPLFPRECSDNHFHLQPLRHLYVLACSHRCLEVRDVDSHKSCFVPLRVTLKETPSHAQTTIRMTAPCILPDYEWIESICIESPRYYASSFDLTNSDMAAYIALFSQLYAKRKSGFLSYEEDPLGDRSIFSRSFPMNFQKEISAEVKQFLLSSKSQFVQAFGAHSNILAFVNQFCDDSVADLTREEQEHSSFCTSIIYECLSNESMEVLFSYLSVAQNAKGGLSPMAAWNVKMIIAYYQSCPFGKQKKILQERFISAIQSLYEKRIREYGAGMQKYCTEDFAEDLFSDEFCAYLIYNDVPCTSVVRQVVKNIAKESSIESKLRVAQDFLEIQSKCKPKTLLAFLHALQ